MCLTIEFTQLQVLDLGITQIDARCLGFSIQRYRKTFIFYEKNKKTIRLVIKNAGKHSEGKSYSVQVLVGISAVYLSIAISPFSSLSSEVFPF